MKTINETSMPGAWIVTSNPESTSSNKGRKSTKNGKVYLDDNQEFIIELFNPLREPVLSDIRMNGKSISKTGLVLNPGQRVYLDCFIDDKKKFVFKTYQVEDNIESENAIQNNGVVEVFFYKEEASIIDNWINRYPTILYQFYPYYVPYQPIITYPWAYPNNPIWYAGDVFCSATGITNTNTLSGGNSNYTFTCDASNSVNNAASYQNTLFTTNTSNYIDTGRIEKGIDSEQKFSDVNNMNFEKYYITHIVYQILPNSKKPAEVSDLNKCECGHKLKPKYKFCPGCGREI